MDFMDWVRTAVRCALGCTYERRKKKHLWVLKLPYHVAFQHVLFGHSVSLWRDCASARRIFFRWLPLLYSHRYSRAAQTYNLTPAITFSGSTATTSHPHYLNYDATPTSKESCSSDTHQQPIASLFASDMSSSIVRPASDSQSASGTGE